MERFTDKTQRLAALDWSSKRALELSPQSPAAWKARALFLQSQGDTEAALEALAAGSRFASDDPELWGLWGELLASVGQLEEAYQKFSRAFAMADAQPGASQAHRELFFWWRWNFMRDHEDIFKEQLAEATVHFKTFFGVLPRDPTAPRELLDLTPWYHSGLDRAWLNQDLYRMDLRELPHGRAALAGIEFDVRGLWQSTSSVLEEKQPGFPRSASALPVGLKCRRLHFLHAADGPETAGTQIGCYQIHYADGQQQDIPILYGKDLLAWILESPAESADVGVAWRKDHPNGVIQQLYKSMWENPRPAIQIDSLDLVSTMTRSPFVLAITAEP